MATNKLEYGIDYVTLVTGRRYKEEILKFLIASGCHLVEVIYAKGSVKSGYMKDMLGLIPEEKKVMITCFIASHMSSQLLEALNTKFDFEKQNTGIAFAIPVDKLSI